MATAGRLSGELTSSRDRVTSLVSLLGEPRATIVELVKRAEHSAPELAEVLGITDVAVRKHLAVLEREGLITERTVKQERGRPVARYRLTERGEGLFPNRYADVVGELLDFLDEEHGRAGLHAFLRWRQDRETQLYADAVDAEDLPERLEQLAAALTAAGYEATVAHDDDGWRLTQTHCAIFEVAKERPEMCAHEAAMFRRVLGDVRVSRRETLAGGDTACVCCVAPRDANDRRSPTE